MDARRILRNVHTAPRPTQALHESYRIAALAAPDRYTSRNG